MNKTLVKTASYLCAACDYEMIRICVVMMFVFLGVNLIQGRVEILIFGEAIPTWIDPVIVLAIMSYTALCAYICAIKFTNDKAHK